MAEDAKQGRDKERDSPYSVCGGCCLFTIFLLILVLILTSLFSGLGAPAGDGASPMMGSPWVIAKCQQGESSDVKYIATLWEICYDRPSKISLAASSAFDANLFKYKTELVGSRDATRVCQEWVDVDEGNSWKELVHAFKSATSAACFALAAILVVGLLLCLIIQSDAKNKCLVILVALLLLVALVCIFLAIQLTVGNGNLMAKQTWEAQTLCTSGTTVTIGEGAYMWIVLCVVICLFILIIFAPLLCACALCGLCAAGDASAAQQGGKGTSSCLDNLCVCVTAKVTKIAAVVEGIYGVAKKCMLKVISCGLPLICFPCFLLDKATKGKSQPSDCMLNVACSALLTVCINVVCGIFWGYPSPYPNNDAIGNPWVVVGCTNNPKTRLLTLFEGCNAFTESAVSCYDWEEYSYGPGNDFRKIMYEELQPLALSVLLLCSVIILVLLIQRVFKKSSVCSPLGFILSLATLAAVISLLAVSSIVALYSSAAMDEAKWISFGCANPDIGLGSGAIVFVIVICLAAVASALFLWPVLAGLAACACCCATCLCACCTTAKGDEDGKKNAGGSCDGKKVMV